MSLARESKCCSLKYEPKQFKNLQKILSKIQNILRHCVLQVFYFFSILQKLRSVIKAILVSCQ